MLTPEEIAKIANDGEINTYTEGQLVKLSTPSILFNGSLNILEDSNFNGKLDLS